MLLPNGITRSCPCCPTFPHAVPRSLFARDRIIAGLADAVIVVEARADGGAVHTARFALQESRPVFVVSWPDMPAGNRQLAGEGATPLDPAQDALSALTA